MAKSIIVDAVELNEEGLPFGGKTTAVSLTITGRDYEEELMNDWRDYEDYEPDTFMVHVNCLKQVELKPIIQAIRRKAPDAKNIKDNLQLLVGCEFSLWWDSENKRYLLWKCISIN